MLLLPIIYKNDILNARVSIKKCELNQSNTKLINFNESEIVANGRRFSQNTQKNQTYLVDYIRTATMYTDNKEVLITTRNSTDSEGYNVYSIPDIPAKVNKGLDSLYGSVLEDIRRSIPDKEKGRNISLEKLGIGLNLTPDVMSRISAITKEVKDDEIKNRYYKNNNLLEVVESIKFLENFDFTIKNEEKVSLDNFKKVLEELKGTNTDLYTKLNKYYISAKANTNIYENIAYAYYLLNDKPCSFIHYEDKTKRKVKRKNNEGK